MPAVLGSHTAQVYYYTALQERQKCTKLTPTPVSETGDYFHRHVSLYSYRSGLPVTD